MNFILFLEIISREEVLLVADWTSRGNCHGFDEYNRNDIDRRVLPWQTV
jgi:hypothetical protein